MNQPRPAPADQFGPYELYERLGMGGMATVHRAKKRGPQGFERSVALKRMLQHLAEDPTFVESFVREAKVASFLQHPNIAQIYDFGRIAGIYYIAMELVAGFDVRRLLRFANRSNEPIPLHVVLHLLGEMCDALEYAHTFVDEQGTPLHIVHRDISPSNLIVSHTGHLKVIDFGIAKAHSRQLHTESGAVKGKLGYMSPEAALGAQVYPVSDIFSMGVVAWELVTASPLFSARTDFETMRRIREADVVPPSIRNPACPQELDSIILAALHRDPERRMPSASAFREALDRIAQKARAPVNARTVSEWMMKFAQPEDSWARSSASGRARSPSGAPPIPLLGEHAPTTNQRPRTPSQPGKGTLRRSEDDIRLANELWDDPAVAPTGALDDFDAAAMGLNMAAPPPASRPSINPQLAPTKVGVGSHPSMPAHTSQPIPTTPSPTSRPLPIMTGVEAVSLPPPPKNRSMAPWFVLVALVGVAATLFTIVLMRDQGQPTTPRDTVAIANDKADEKSVDDEDRVLSPDETPKTNGRTEPKSAVKDPGPKPAVRDPEPKPRDTKRPNTHRPPTKRTGHVEKAVEPTPDPKHTEPVDPPKPAVVDPPKPVVVDPPKPVVVDPPKPVEPPKPARTPIVAASAVTKISGELPAMRVAADDASVTAKLCIDEGGKVSSVKLVKAPADLTADLTRALSSWKYKPYMNRDSKLSPACFVVSLRLVVK